MMNKRLLFLALVLSLVLNAAIAAQTESEETVKVRKRAESLLQTIRNEEWDEISKFVVVVKEYDEITKKFGKTFQLPADDETKEKIVKRFKQTYSALKPGKIISVNISKKDKTIAGISYKHGDKDGFTMFLIDDEWYYGVQYLQ